MTDVAALPGFGRLVEPYLAFHPERPNDRHRHPLQGLIEFGPYSRSTINEVMDPIRVAMIGPKGQLGRLQQLLRELEQQHQPRERQQYLPAFPGFSRIFGLRVVAAEPAARIELPDSLGDQVKNAEKPHLVVAEAITRALSVLAGQRDAFDVVLIYLPDAWEPAFEGGPGEDFDLHDYVKAVTASRHIPSQMIVEGSALAYRCRASVGWRLGIALYCKAGGTPWKLAYGPTETAYVGLSYALVGREDGGTRFVTCCSQVFDADGGGPEFIAYQTDEFTRDGENPFLSRADMRRVMARSLALYQRRHGGDSPKHVVVHKSTEFKPDEVDGCFDALGNVGVELIQIQDDVAWRGLAYLPPKGATAPTTPAAFPVERGTTLQLGGREVLLWTAGNATSVAAGKNYFKEGKGIPSPLLLRRFSGHGAMDTACSAVLGLSKMDWNNDGLYDRLPVTLSYASVLARTVRRMPTLAATPYQFRFFM